MDVCYFVFNIILYVHWYTIGSDVNEADVDLEIIEIKSKGNIVSDEACFSDEIGIDDEISSEIQELTAKGSCEVNTFI